MSWQRVVRLLCLAGSALLVGCGTSDDNSGVRPVQIILTVEGPSGAHFRAERIQVANADHCFVYGDAVPQTPCRSQASFEAPYQFVLINAQQFRDPDDPTEVDVEHPIRATFGVPSQTFDAAADTVTVRLFFGLDQRQAVTIPPGKCFTIPGDLAVLGDYDCAAGGCACTLPVALPLDPRPREARFELCHATSGGVPCNGGVPPPDQPINIGFTISVGDFTASDSSFCSLQPTPADPCLTPALVYLEGAEDAVQGVFSNLGARGTRLQADFYVNNDRRASNIDDDNVIIDEQL